MVRREEIQENNNNQIAIGLGLSTVIVALILLFIMVDLQGNSDPYTAGFELGQKIASIFKSPIFKNGLSFGSLIAVLVSWECNKSIRWAIFHAIVGWFYVIYFILTRKRK